MTQVAFIKVQPQSKKTSLSYEDVKEILLYYQDITRKTGEQLNWEYAEAAFPYTIQETSTDGHPYLLLKGNNDPNYHSIYLDLVSSPEETKPNILRVTLSSSSTYGDKGKANELCRFIAKKWEAELQLFNERTMYFYDRK